MKKLQYIILMLICLLGSNCKYIGKEVGPTVIYVQDSIRHYMPIMQGEAMEIKFRVANVGKEPLVLTDIHPSCGCISANGEHNNIILPGKEQTFAFTFHSDKYVGYVQHNIYLYGNIANEYGLAILYFDVNVVKSSNASIDYEEYYYENNKIENLLNQGINGTNANKGYYINKGDYPEDYESQYKRYPWREKEHQ